MSVLHPSAIVQMIDRLKQESELSVMKVLRKKVVEEHQNTKGPPPPPDCSTTLCSTPHLSGRGMVQTLTGIMLQHQTPTVS